MKGAINTHNLFEEFAGKVEWREMLPSAISTTFYLFIYSALVSGNIPEAQTGGTEIFEVASLCNRPYPTQMHRKIDSAVIISRNDKNLDCEVTFSAEYVSQRFLIRFTEFNMECGDRLHIYDSANAIGSSRAELSCRFLGPESIQPIRTRGHYVTLKFTADNWGTDANKFTMIITAFKDPNQGCRDAFVCGQECITNRLLCDKTPNCLDGADETGAANCTSNFLDLLRSFDSPTEIGIGLSVISVVIVVTCFCYCIRHQRRTPTQSPDIYNHGKSRNEASGSNGAGTMIALNDKPSFHSLQQNTLESLRKSGNLHLPAESQGYTTTHLRLRPCFMGN